jgi:hypothetical protein
MMVNPLMMVDMDSMWIFLRDELNELYGLIFRLDEFLSC